MGRFTTVRGWLECRYEDVPAMRRRADGWVDRGAAYHLTPDQAALYVKGWAYPEVALNSTSLVFFGAQVRAQAVDFVRAMVEDVAQATQGGSADPDDLAEGLSFLDDDDGKAPALWRVAAVRVREERRTTQLA